MGHTLRQCFVFKELVQEGLRTKALTLGEEEKKATTNMVSIRFGAQQPVSIPVEEMDPLDTEVRVIPDDSEEIQRGLVAVNSPDGDSLWVDPDLNEDDDWEVVTPKARMKGSGHPCCGSCCCRCRGHFGHSFEFFFLQFKRTGADQCCAIVKCFYFIPHEVLLNLLRRIICRIYEVAKYPKVEIRDESGQSYVWWI